MMYTALAFAVLTGSVLLVLTNLRHVAHDTAQALAGAVSRARTSGRMRATLAYCALWLLIFALCYF